jgi:ribonucleoside-diphosphate reductase alpha chain
MEVHISAFLNGYADKLETPQFNEDAIKILSERYLIKDDDGEVIELIPEFLARVAIGVQYAYLSNEDMDELDIEKVYEIACSYYNMMARLDFLPGSPTLMNAGTQIGQLSACFVVPVGDSMPEIMEAVKSVALIHQSGGGTGMDFSSLRPAGSLVGSTSGVASGPISFMKIFDATTEQIKQGGKRRGANMGMLRVDHPDILEFIVCKDDDVSLQNFNISVAITDDFMEALYGNGAGGGDSSYEYDIINPKDGMPMGRLDAREVWGKIVQHAHNTGDPGIIFIDKVNEGSPFDVDTYPEHIMVATNPCGEQPLEPYEACNLGSINVANFCDRNDYDYPRLSETVKLAVQMLDDVVSSSRFPMPEITAQVQKNRKIGLGVMGFADSLLTQHIAYGSEQSFIQADRLMSFIQAQARLASQKLGQELGYFATVDHLKPGSTPRRNAAITTIAPTGTISMLANGTSSGIEPVFAFTYTKKVMDGKLFNYVHPAIAEQILENEEDKPVWWDEFLATGQFPEAVKLMWPHFVGAMDVTAEEHIRMQCMFQDSVDNAVSKTVNLPFEATVKDVNDIYLLAYELGAKGTTIYRDGSKSDQVLFTGSKSENVKVDPTEAKPLDELLDEFVSDTEIGRVVVDDIPVMVVRDAESFDTIVEALESPEKYELIPTDEYKHLCKCQKSHETRPRPEAMLGLTVKTDTPCGHLYVTISEDEDGAPFEVFCKLGKSGACAGAVQETMGRLISQELRSGGDVTRIIKQLRGASCGQKVGFGPNSVTSCIDAIGLVLQRYANGEFHQQVMEPACSSFEVSESVDTPVDKPVDLPADGPGALLVNETAQVAQVKTVRRNGACPECGSGAFEHEGGCAVCRSCGFSKCA